MTENQLFFSRIGIVVVIFSIAAGVVLFVMPDSPPLGASEATEISKIENAQQVYFQQNGKYFYEEKKVGDLNFEINNYKTPRGELGYTITLTQTKNGVIKRKRINYGAEQGNDYDWVEIGQVFTNSTSTP